jgi:hypothetical protein
MTEASAVISPNGTPDERAAAEGGALPLER